MLTLSPLLLLQDIILKQLMFPVRTSPESKFSTTAGLRNRRKVISYHKPFPAQTDLSFTVVLSGLKSILQSQKHRREGSRAQFCLLGMTGTYSSFLVLFCIEVLVWFTFSISRTLSCISFRAQWDSASLSLAWTSSFSSCSTKSSLYRELHLCYKVCRNMFSMKYRLFERGFIYQIWWDKYIQVFNIRSSSISAYHIQVINVNPDC